MKVYSSAITYFVKGAKKRVMSGRMFSCEAESLADGVARMHHLCDAADHGSTVTIFFYEHTIDGGVRIRREEYRVASNGSFVNRNLNISWFALVDWVQEEIDDLAADAPKRRNDEVRTWFKNAKLTTPAWGKR